MRKVFFVSRAFPWDRVIYPGSGPPFGEAYGWPVRRVDELDATPCDVAIVENRLDAADVAHLDRFLARPADRRPPLLFKWSDPEMPRARDAGVRFLLGKADHPGVHYLSVYEPAGPLRDLAAGLRRSRVLRAPFPYDVRREVDVPLEDRARRLFLAGKHDARLYPARARWVRRRRLDPLARLLVARLPHPGYPDLGRPARHDVLGPRFVPYAARHTHFFVDGSRHGVELMKYVECAYAGCVPLGDVPGSLASVVGADLVRSPSGVLALLAALRRPLDGLRDVAARYRAALRAARDPARLDAALDAALADLPR